MRNKSWEQSDFTKVVRVTEEDYEWLKQHKLKKSLAGFLKHVIAKIKIGKNLD